MMTDNAWIQHIDHRISAAVIFFVLLVLLRAPRVRKQYALHLAASFVIMAAASLMIRVVTENMAHSLRLEGVGYMLQLLAMYMLFLLCYRMCYQAATVDTIYAGVLALSVFKIAWNVFKTGSSWMAVGMIPVAWSRYSIMGSLMSYLVYLLFCTACVQIYRRLAPEQKLHSPLRGMVILSLIFVLLQMMLEYCGHVFTASSGALFLYYLCALLYSIINYAALVMIAQLDSFRHENRSMHDFISNKMRYYEMSREGIVSLQTTCHDLKHQISAIRDQAGKRDFEQYLDELENTIEGYSGIVECGHPTVDIVLTEKKLLCAADQVKFSYMIDGKLFSFLTDREIYSLFGNALDNALEAVRKVENPANRMITLKSNLRGGMVVLQVENTCASPVNLSGGLPRTTKENAAQHGFGLRSIQRLADKHNGSMSVRMEENVFKLSVIMRPEKETELTE